MTRVRAAPLVVVNSGRFAEQELVAEFGALPPAMFPVGVTRLYELQAALFAPIDAQLCLTLPRSYELPSWDAERLAALGFTVIRTPDELELGAALLYALGRLGFHDRPLKILHGDTLIDGIDLRQSDLVAVAEGGAGYRWAHAKVAAGGKVELIEPPLQGGTQAGPQLCGYFAFASASRFAERLATSSGDFHAALNNQAANGDLAAVTPEKWLDFGHVQTFFRSRRIVTTQRAFNSLQIGETDVRKRSINDAAKLKAEARWLAAVPSSVAPFCARLLGEGEDEQGYFYDTEYEYMPTLSELYVFGRMKVPSWQTILHSCKQFADTAAQAGASENVAGLLRRLAIDKTADRLATFSQAASIDLDAPLKLNGRPAPSLNQCLREIDAALADCGDMPAIMHGDFCFSNILYNFRTQRIKLIDPRGLTEQGEFSLYGDQRYDMAKLMHSVCGRYDLIIAGQYAGRRVGAESFELTFPDDRVRSEVEDTARAMSFGGVRLGSHEVWAAMTSLFLSMPPLHADRPDRQAAFIGNALRLHFELEAT